MAFKDKARTLEYGRKWYRENKARHHEAVKAWRARNPEKSRAIGRKSSRKNKDSARVYRAANKDKIAQYHVSHRAKNKGLYAGNTARYRAAKKRARPAWADDVAIETGYVVAAALREVGVPVEVDHLVPLVSDLVCGLHTHDNLTIVSFAGNRQKGNRHWPEMWLEGEAV